MIRNKSPNIEPSCTGLGQLSADPNEKHLRHINSANSSALFILSRNPGDLKLKKAKKYEEKINQLNEIIYELTEDKEKLAKENLKFKTENSELHKMNKELYARVTNQRTLIDKLYVELSRNTLAGVKSRDITKIFSHRNLKSKTPQKHPKSIYQVPKSLSRHGNKSYDDIIVLGANK